MMTHHKNNQTAGSGRYFFALIFLLPVLLVACVDTGGTELDAEPSIAKLEAKVAYLRSEIEAGRAAVEALRPTEEDSEFESKSDRYNNENMYWQLRRYPVLSQMLIDQIEILEAAKMEYAVADL